MPRSALMVMQTIRGCAEGQWRDLKKQQNSGKQGYYTLSRNEYSITTLILSSPRGFPIIVGHGLTALAWMRVGVVWTFFSSLILPSPLPFLWEMARYRLRYCLKGPLNQKTTNQRHHRSARTQKTAIQMNKMKFPALKCTDKIQTLNQVVISMISQG